MGRSPKKRKQAQAKQKKPNLQKPSLPLLPPESRGAEALTIAWTLSVMALVALEVVMLAVWILVKNYPEQDKLKLLMNLILFVLVTLSVISLILLPIVRKVRTLLPPVGFTLFASVVSAIPFLLLARLF